MTSCAAHRLQVCGGLEETLWHRRPPSYSLSWSALHEVLHHKFNLISAFRRAAMILWGHVTPVCRTCKYMSWCTCIYYNGWNTGNWHLTFWLTCWPSKVCWCHHVTSFLSAMLTYTTWTHRLYVKFSQAARQLRQLKKCRWITKMKKWKKKSFFTFVLSISFLFIHFPYFSFLNWFSGLTK